MSDKMSLLESLKNKPICPECGRWNNCAMEEGKSASSCWCMTEPVKEMDEVSDSCLCKICYRKK